MYLKEEPIEEFMNELFEYSSKIKQKELKKQEEEKIKRQNEAKRKFFIYKILL